MAKQRENKSKGKTSQKEKGHFKGGRSYVKGSTPVKKKTQPKQVSNPDEIRLNKYIANSGICSRREADMHISIGSVTVNGKVITEMRDLLNSVEEGSDSVVHSCSHRIF